MNNRYCMQVVINGPCMKCMCVHVYNVAVSVCYPNVKKGDVVALTMYVMYVYD